MTEAFVIPSHPDGTYWQATRDLFRQMSPARRRHFYAVMVLIVLGAVGELVTLGALLPFLALLADPTRVHEIGLLADIFSALGANTVQQQIFTATIIFAFAALAAGGIRLILTWYSQSFAFKLGHEIGVEIHRRMLKQSYSYHVATNSSHVIAALEKIEMLVSYVLLPIMQAASAFVIALFIVAVLIYVDPAVAFLSAGAFCVIYVVVSMITRRRLGTNSKIVNSAFALRVQTLQESLGAIRDIIIDKSHMVYVGQFARVDARFRRAQTVNTFIGSAPRFIIESAGMVLIAALALYLSGSSGGLAAALPVLGVLALGAQRLLPLMQQVYLSWAYIGGNREVVFEIVELLHLPIPSADVVSPPSGTLEFNSEIRFEAVSFSYADREEVLSDIDLTIPRGGRVALIGKTGSGKSTLLDLLMGLLDPSTGQITIDGVPINATTRDAWQTKIAHVPQSIFLSDTTIERNIAFGVEEGEINRQRVEEAARKAELHDFILSLPEGYDTEVGERGVRLSGGQRQRLGIARALYKRAPVLVLDEATSALDDSTEAAVMKTLEQLDERLTLVMIAHRLSTIANFDVVVRMDGGRIIDNGSYAEVIGNSPAKSRKTYRRN